MREESAKRPKTREREEGSERRERNIADTEWNDRKHMTDMKKKHTTGARGREGAWVLGFVHGLACGLAHAGCEVSVWGACGRTCAGESQFLSKDVVGKCGCACACL